MKKLSFILIAALLALTVRSQGLVMEPLDSAFVESWQPEKYGYTSAQFPSRISYRKYTPAVSNQGKLATCVGWATAYAHLTTQQNLVMGVSKINQRTFRAMDPHFVYAFIRNSNDQWCQNGTSMNDAIEVLQLFGVKPQVWSPWLTCNSSEVIKDNTLAKASSYKIGEAYSLNTGEEIVNSMKTALKEKYIVSIGIDLTSSFQNGSTVYSGKWSPKATDSYIGGHAMCVVGYDDNKYGGAFEIMNSYGSDFGDNGFVWVSYKDCIKHISKAVIFETPGFSSYECLFGDCQNSFSIYRTSDGGLYEGLLTNGKPDVYGAYHFNDGSFYVGGLNKGRKHGYGILYDMKSNNYYKVSYKNDVLVNSAAISGFANDEDAEKLEQLYKELSTLLSGDLKDEDSDAYDELQERYEVPLEPIKIKSKVED